MDIGLLILRVFDKLRKDGIASTYSTVVEHLKSKTILDDFDHLHGTDTGGSEPLWKFQISSPNRRFGTRYQPTTERELIEAINFLDESPADFTFIDLGCGKGRTLLIAAKLGFRHVIGVEFAHELVRTARMNLATVGNTRAVVEDTDVVDFVFPNSDIVVYLYNPFSQEIMRKVIERLRECRANRLFLIYKNPKFPEIIDSSGFLTTLGSPVAAPNIRIWKGED